MNIAIIGAGFTGLQAAYTLQKKGHHVFLFEKDAKPGGLAIGFHVPSWKWTLEKHYHHWFANDDDILNLARDINYPVEIRRPVTSVFVASHMYQLDSPTKVLTFPLLSIKDRLRMAFALSLLRFSPYSKFLEKHKASDVLPRLMGKKAYSMLWEPQLTNKFSKYKDEISLAWFWARIKQRTAKLCYPKGGFLRFTEALEEKLKQKGAVFFYNTNVSRIKEHKGKLTLMIENKRGKKVYHNSFDKILVTLPAKAFTTIAEDLPREYIDRVTSLQSLGAINLVIRLSKPFFQDKTYWLSVCDRSSPLMAIVEHTNFMDKTYYNNEHVIYVGNYLPLHHRFFSYSPEKLLHEYDPFLQKINKEYRQHIIGTHMFQAPFAQPIIPINYSKKIPPFTTPLRNVYLANMQQVYPWDRGTNYAVALGKKVATLIEKES